MGRLYTLYSMKKLYVLSLIIFFAGSILTAASPKSTAYILGRAVSCLGAAGINSGMYMLVLNMMD
jgi:MFS family permease